MKTTTALIRRNIKLFFKDKGLFFTSLITPLILLVLYTTFLGNVYRDSFLLSVPEFMQNEVSDIIDGCVGGQLVSSLLAVSCITVAFCSNMLMVQDKVSGAYNDISVTPVKHTRVAISYYAATFLVTLIINLVALVAGLIYIAAIGWYLTVSDVLFLILDILLAVLFGTALSSLIGFFLSSQGQISAVGSIVSSCYGFICGAYMPISQFSEGLQTVISFLPGTYATSLFRNHAMGGALDALTEKGIPVDAITELRNVVDCNIYFLDTKVSIGAMFAVITLTIAVIMTAYVLINKLKGGKARAK
ncbi:MAG: ABC transporter permease [Clostridia bacterium]|nr:ABC transporter permease [Clostridia bacterium]